MAGTSTGCFCIFLEVLGAGSFYKVVGPMREANLFCCHTGIGQKWRVKEKKSFFVSVSILSAGSNNMAGWEPGGVHWKRLWKVLLNLCRYVNLDMVTFKGSI